MMNPPPLAAWFLGVVIFDTKRLTAQSSIAWIKKMSEGMAGSPVYRARLRARRFIAG
jgi:hypothetical protein